MLIKNDDYNITIRSSMNLNENKRCENYDVDDNKEIYDFFNDFVEEVFTEMPVGMTESRATVDDVFDKIFAQPATEVEKSPWDSVSRWAE